MDGVDIRPDDLRAVAAAMAEHNAAISARMDQLLDRLSTLRKSWEGPAAVSFDAAKSDWQEWAEQHAAKFVPVPDYLRGVQQAFTSTDDAGATSIASTDEPS